jgi:hypothetical protein
MAKESPDVHRGAFGYYKNTGSRIKKWKLEILKKCYIVVTLSRHNVIFENSHCS